MKYTLLAFLATSATAAFLKQKSQSSSPLDDFIETCAAGSRPSSCPFKKEGFKPLNAHNCAMEMTTVQELHTYLEGSNRKVLELGARYGTTSCTIAKAVVPHGGLVVSVEPDTRVWAPLSSNLASNGCSVNLVKGVLSKQQLYTHPETGTYGHRVTKKVSATKTPSFSLSSVMQKYNVDKFDTLVMDCQGCVPQFLNENPEILQTVTLLIMEEDSYGSGATAAAFYNPVHEKLKNAGFRLWERNADEGSPGTNAGDWVWTRGAVSLPTIPPPRDQPLGSLDWVFHSFNAWWFAMRARIFAFEECD